MVRLYSIDSSNRVRVWQCYVSFDADSETLLSASGIYTQDGLQDGKMKNPVFKASKEMNIGRSNYMSAEDYAHEMVRQEVSKKLKSNYFYSVQEAQTQKIFLPMLAHKFKDYEKTLEYPVYSQPKLDGARCNIYWSEKENKVAIVSRTGKEYLSCPHILHELISICEKHKNIVFDGEIYNHDLKHEFEKLMSLCRKSKPTEDDLVESSEKLEYHIYDIYDKDYPDLSYNERSTKLSKLFTSFEFDKIKFVPDMLCKDRETLDRMEELALENGYEGLMIRIPNSAYKVDGRSKELLKRKNFIDAEFPIVDIIEGEGAWKGKAKKVIVLLPNGKHCGCGIDGSFEINQERFENKEKYIGKLATVKYFRLTKDDMLYIPVCKQIDRHD